MDILKKLLQYIPSEIGILVAWIVFMVGFGAGVLASWPLKTLAPGLLKRRANKTLDEDISSLKNELSNVNAEVGKLWSTTFPAQTRHTPELIKTHAADKKESIISADLINAAKILKSLAENLNSIAHNVEPRSNRNAETPSPQQESSSPEQPSIPITRQAYRRQHLQENYVDEVESAPAAVYDAPEDNMVQLYNRAVTDTVARERFREHFCPLRIGTVNAVERRQNPTIKAEIKETTDGDFFAVPRGSNEFSVFPRLGLTIEAVSFGAGAIGEVYKTKGHDPKQFYSRYCVKKPAIFELEGELWVLREPGELEFSFGD
jgi:hypothetical protein